MVTWIVIITGIAVLFYASIPLLFAMVHQKNALKLLEILRTSPGIPATVQGLSEGNLVVQPDAGKQGSPKELMILRPKKTRFYGISLHGSFYPIRWRDILSFKQGGTVMVFQRDPQATKTLCIFHEERNVKAFQDRLDKALPSMDNTIKPYSIATGVLIEFVIFIHALQNPEMTAVSLLALIAIFGKALPYCPPGLLLTYYGHRITVHAGMETKKSRQRGTVGIALYIAGIVLNIAVLIFIISSVEPGGKIF